MDYDLGHLGFSQFMGYFGDRDYMGCMDVAVGLDEGDWQVDLENNFGCRRPQLANSDLFHSTCSGAFDTKNIR